MLNRILLYFFILILNNSYALASPAPFDKCGDLPEWKTLPQCNTLFDSSNARIISGNVNSFDGQSVENPCLFLFDKKEGDVVCVHEGEKSGHFKFYASRQSFHSLATVRGYAINHLETWVKNLPKNEDLELTLRIGRLEIYGTEVHFSDQKINISFIPWSLGRYLNGLPLNDITPLVTDDGIFVEFGSCQIDGIKIEGFDSASGKYSVSGNVSKCENQTPKTIKIKVFSIEYNEWGESQYFCDWI